MGDDTFGTMVALLAENTLYLFNSISVSCVDFISMCSLLLLYSAICVPVH